MIRMVYIWWMFLSWFCIQFRGNPSPNLPPASPGAWPLHSLNLSASAKQIYYPPGLPTICSSASIIKATFRYVHCQLIFLLSNFIMMFSDNILVNIMEHCIRAPSKRVRYWEIHPRCPRDFPRPERCSCFIENLLGLILDFERKV